MTTTKEDLQRQVNDIANILSNADTFADEQRQAHGDDFDEDEHTGAYAWLSDVLDVNWVVSRDGSYLGARVLVAFGGPNIWVDFEENEVQGYWGGDVVKRFFRDDMDISSVLESEWEDLR